VGIAAEMFSAAILLAMKNLASSGSPDSWSELEKTVIC
jgi:hypothetical protein